MGIHAGGGLHVGQGWIDGVHEEALRFGRRHRREAGHQREHEDREELELHEEHRVFVVVISLFWVSEAVTEVPLYKT